MNNIINRWPIWIVFAVLIWLLYALQSILMPFFAAALLAYLCNPLVDRLMKWRFSRIAAVSTVFSVLFLTITTTLVLLIPMLWRQFMYLESRLPFLLKWINRKAIPWLEKSFKVDLDRLDMDLITSWLTSYWQEAGTAAGHVLTRVAQSSLDIISIVGLISLVPVVTFYLLLDWDKIINQTKELIPRHLESTVVRLATECNDVLSAFLLSGITSAGTKPYFCVILTTPVHCPPSPIGFLNNHSTFLSSSGLSFVSIISCKKKLDFSN